MSEFGSEIEEWRGRTVVDADGDKLGTLDEVYVDDRTGKLEWAFVSTGGLFGGKARFVPLAQAREGGDEIQVASQKDQVKTRRSSTTTVS